MEHAATPPLSDKIDTERLRMSKSDRLAVENRLEKLWEISKETHRLNGERIDRLERIATKRLALMVAAIVLGAASLTVRLVQVVASTQAEVASVGKCK